MHDFFRKGLGRWIALAIVGLAAVGLLFLDNQSFGVGGGATVATIGGRDVTVSEFRREYTDTLSQSPFRGATPRDLMALGFHLSVLERVAQRAALADEAESIGLAAPDARLRQEIVANRAFFGPNGAFNQSNYEFYLRQQGFRPREYERLLREIVAAQIVSGAAVNRAAGSETLAELLWRRGAERRDVAYITLTAEAPDAVRAPTEAELDAFHAENPERFTTPETREVGVFWMRPADVADPDTIADDAARTLYDARLDTLTRPERRNIERIIYSDETAAAAAATRLRDADAEARADLFAALAAEVGLTGADSSLGFLTREDLALFGETTADALFSGAAETAQNAVIGPLETPAGHAVYRVAAVVPEQVTPFEAVADRLKGELALDAARRRLSSVQIAIEDQRAAGAALEEIAEQEGALYRRVSITRTGLDADGAPVAGLPDRARLLPMVWPADPSEDADIVGLERDMERLDDDGFFTAEVVSISPARLRPLDEARDAVVAAWRASEAASALEIQAEEALERVRAGAPLETLAEEFEVEVATAEDLRVGQNVPGVPAAALAELFRAGTEAGAAALGALDAAAAQEAGRSGGSEDPDAAGRARRVLVVVSAVGEAEGLDAGAGVEAVRQELQAAVAGDLQESFILANRSVRDLLVNEPLLEAAIGAGQGPHGAM